MGTGTEKQIWASRRRLSGVHAPAAAFAIATLAALGGLAFGATTLPKDLALAVASSIFLTCAALVALVACRFGNSGKSRLSYWDVAGALALIGICAATVMDSKQFVSSLETLLITSN